MKYGVISDIHGSNPRIITEALAKLQSEGINKLIVNGDIGNNQGTIEKTQGYIGFILETIGKTGIETYVQPGSHESIRAYHPAIDILSEKYTNLIDVIKRPKIEEEDHHLIFLPGSDVNIRGGEYTFGTKKPTGYFMAKGQDKEGNILFEDFDIREIYLVEKEIKKIEAEIGKGAKLEMPFLRYENIKDLEKRITEPEKTILVSHVPPKFEGEKCIDHTYFGENEKGVIPGIMLELAIKKRLGNYDGSATFSDSILQKEARKIGYELKKENRGNKELEELITKLGIKKGIFGHFHESGHKANDNNSEIVEEETEVNSLFWNSGQLDKGKLGIYKVKNGKTSYKNLQLEI